MAYGFHEIKEHVNHVALPLCTFPIYVHVVVININAIDSVNTQTSKLQYNNGECARCSNSPQSCFNPIIYSVCFLMGPCSASKLLSSALTLLESTTFVLSNNMTILTYHYCHSNKNCVLLLCVFMEKLYRAELWTMYCSCIYTTCSYRTFIVWALWITRAGKYSRSAGAKTSLCAMKAVGSQWFHRSALLNALSAPQLLNSKCNFVTVILTTMMHSCSSVGLWILWNTFMKMNSAHRPRSFACSVKKNKPIFAD